MSSVEKLASFIILGFFIIFQGACSTKEVSHNPVQSTPTVQKTNEPPVVETSQSKSEAVIKSNYILDPVASEKAKPLFEAIIKNDDKKAKLAYGRAVRFLPDIVQLAVDLRLKNYDHATGVLPKTSLSSQQQDFWNEMIKKRPGRLESVVCEALIANPSFPTMAEKVPEEETAWLKYFDDVAFKIVNPEGTIKEQSDLTKSLERVICTERECGPIQDNLKEELLTDKFFDHLHNMRRRDTRFYKASFKSPLKIWQYRPYVSDMALYKFYQALKNTPYEKQSHFIRRFKGIARDMRSETILSRSIADIILGDDEDLALAKRFGYFLTSNSLISAVTRIEGSLPSCDQSKPSN